MQVQAGIIEIEMTSIIMNLFNFTEKRELDCCHKPNIKLNNREAMDEMWNSNVHVSRSLRSAQ